MEPWLNVEFYLCLQVEPCDDNRENDACSVLHSSSGVISGMPATKQVNHFMSDGFVT